MRGRGSPVPHAPRGARAPHATWATQGAPDVAPHATWTTPGAPDAPPDVAPDVAPHVAPHLTPQGSWRRLLGER